MRCFSLLMVVVVAATASVAQAQPGGGRFGGFGGGSRLGLLRIEEVQKEIGLTEDQLTAVRKLQEELQPPGRRGEGAGQFTEEDRERLRKEFEERSKKEREELAKQLKPDQLKRLTEIYVQVAGPAAISDADIAKELEITDEQKEKLAKVRDESLAGIRELFGAGDREAARTKFAEMRKASEEKTMAVLTDAQKKELEELKGKKFDLPEGAFRRGGRGNRPDNN